LRIKQTDHLIFSLYMTDLRTCSSRNKKQVENDYKGLHKNAKTVLQKHVGTEFSNQTVKPNILLSKPSSLI